MNILITLVLLIAILSTINLIKNLINGVKFNRDAKYPYMGTVTAISWALFYYLTHS